MVKERPKKALAVDGVTVDALQKLKVEDGDLLVLHVLGSTENAEYERLNASMAVLFKRMGIKAHCLVVTNGAVLGYHPSASLREIIREVAKEEWGGRGEQAK